MSPSPANPEQKLSTVFEEIWAAFEKKPFPLPWDQTLILLEGLQKRNLLTAPIADNIIYALRLEPTWIERLQSEPLDTVYSRRRLDLWQASDATTLALVSWAPKTLTSIHSHHRFGLTRTLEGSMVSLGFKEEPGGEALTYLGRVHFEINRVYHVPVGKGFIHALTNTGDTEAIEVHFYGPETTDRKSQTYFPRDNLDLLALEDGQTFAVNVGMAPAYP